MRANGSTAASMSRASARISAWHSRVRIRICQRLANRFLARSSTAFVTAGFNDYFRPAGVSVLQEGVLEDLSTLASRIALEAAARLPLVSECLCGSLKSEQPPERYLRW